MIAMNDQNELTDYIHDISDRQLLALHSCKLLLSGSRLRHMTVQLACIMRDETENISSRKELN